MIQYITKKRMKGLAICGLVNIPFATALPVDGDFILWQGRPLCAIASKQSHEFFASDHDGHGLERGALTSAILATLSKRDTQWQARWDRVWDAEYCQKFRNPAHEDFWVWAHAFYVADLDELKALATLVGAKVKGR